MSTKLHAPAPRERTVARGGLLARLDAADAPPLTLVDAPAGWGKTTLLTDWLGDGRRRGEVAWLSLEPADSDPARFWTYVVEALRTVAPGVGAEALGALRAARAPAAEAVLPALLNEIAASPVPLVLVLDDYHALAGDEVHAGMRFVVDHQPEPLRLVIATRSDPPLPLPRLRAQGRMLEIRTDDLRFSAEEAGRLLNGALGLGLAPADVELLHARTEGWAAGLYLAALSLRGQSDAHAFVQAFAGDERHVVDYLASEVLDGQPQEIRSFLLRTSILERLSGPLCDAVVGGRGSAEVLEAIERGNLFVVPMDSRRRWYRYHRLFGRLLRTELERTAPGEVPALHARAAAWFREAGEPSDALTHARAAGLVDECVELIAANWTQHFNLGRLATVTSWLDALPEDVVAGSPALAVARAWVAMDLGRPEEAGRWVDLAEAALAARPADAPDRVDPLDVRALHCVHLFKSGDLDAAGAAARRSLSEGSAEPSFHRTVASCVLGAVAYWQGDPAGAEAALAEGAGLAAATGNDLARTYCLGYRALVALDRGDPPGAEALAAEAEAVSGEPGFGERFVAVARLLARARAQVERGDLDGAAADAARALERARRGAGRIELAAALLRLAEVRSLRGAGEPVDALLAEAGELLAACPDPGRVTGELRRARAALAAASSAADRPAELTERELAVLRLLATRLTRAEIAASLFVSENTVKTHARGVYRKLGASDREGAVARARSLGLL